MVYSFSLDGSSAEPYVPTYSTADMKRPEGRPQGKTFKPMTEMKSVHAWFKCNGGTVDSIATTSALQGFQFDPRLRLLFEWSFICSPLSTKH